MREKKKRIFAVKKGMNLLAQKIIPRRKEPHHSCPSPHHSPIQFPLRMLVIRAYAEPDCSHGHQDGIGNNHRIIPIGA